MFGGTCPAGDVVDSGFINWVRYFFVLQFGGRYASLIIALSFTVFMVASRSLWRDF